jgi:hypothetical protein
MYTTEPLEPVPSSFEVENAIGKLEAYKSSDTDQISAQLIQTGGEILHSEIHTVNLIIF